MSSSDELYLWGLLALTLSQSDSTGNLVATPHWCLRQLGLIDAKSRRGGRQYKQFSDAIRRLSVVNYLNNAFYDPVRAEHRNVSFGFFSYSLPKNPDSNRSWCIAWDPIFFEMVKAGAGQFRFDLAVYRQLDAASRRLFLFASKILYRRSTLPNLTVRKLAVDILGNSNSVATRDLKIKVQRCLSRLTELGVFSETSIRRIKAGTYLVQATRGRHFDANLKNQITASSFDCPLVESLVGLGCTPGVARNIKRKYKRHDVERWLDITQAALEKHGQAFFKRSAVAYLIDSLKASASGTRTPPDWWLALRSSDVKSEQVSNEGRKVLTRLQEEVFATTEPTETGTTSNVTLVADVLRRIAEMEQENPN